MPPFTRPEMPERYSSLVSAKCRNELDEIKKRKVSLVSQISFNSTTEDFIRAKEVSVTFDLEYAGMLRRGLREACQNGALGKTAYDEAMTDLDGSKHVKQQELIVHKRQKKILTEDVEEQLPRYNNMETAYANVLVNKVMSANAKQKKSKFEQSKFRAAVDKYYNSKKVEDGLKMAWCHALGRWFDHKAVKAAHLAAKSLDGHDLSYLFGVGEAVLMDPTNGLTLSSKVELGLDTGLIVLVPVKKGCDINWKIMLTDKNQAKDMVTANPKTHWRDLDGQDLKFLGPQRPAKRFLYFRFVITYLYAKKAGDMPWVAEIEAKGHMWVTPGPYLRQSMLVTLARQISDHYLPEAFLEGATFAEAAGSPRMSPEDEEIAALSLAMKIDDERINQQQRLIDWEKLDDEDEDEDGEDRDEEDEDEKYEDEEH